MKKIHSLLAALTLSGCATVSNTAVGPFVGVVESHKQYSPIFGEILRGENKYKPLIIPAIALYPAYLGIHALGGLPIGFTNGLSADIYRFRNGTYPEDYSIFDLGSGEQALYEDNQNEN